MKDILQRLKFAVVSSLRPALKTAFWMLKIMLPITLGVAILDYLGVVTWASELMSPMFSLLGLPGEAGLVFITSIAANLYSVIAVMASLSLDLRSVSILAVMCLIAHNMIIECLIQRKTGAPIKFIAPLRIVSALVAGMLLNWIMPKEMTGNLMFPEAQEVATSWGEMFKMWALNSYPLVIKMFVIIISLNVLQNILREFGIIKLLIYPLRPLMRIFGLQESTSFLWIVANMIGLAYGGAIMIEEINKGEVAKEEALLFNTHIALSHSILEDSLIFMVIGVSLVWILIPRILLAILAVWSVREIRGKFMNKEPLTIKEQHAK